MQDAVENLGLDREHDQVGHPRDRTVVPYAGEPQDMSPYSKFATPYDLNYTRPNIYTGAGRDIPEPKNITEIRIGFFGPIEHSPDQKYGLRMLHGAQMAIDELNARGGYGGKPFKLMLHNDYDNWQAKAVYGDDRSTDPTIWGSASNEAVKKLPCVYYAAQPGMQPMGSIIGNQAG